MWYYTGHLFSHLLFRYSKKTTYIRKVWGTILPLLAACTVRLPKSVRLMCKTHGSASHARMRFSSPGRTPLELSPQHTSRYVTGNNLICLVPSITQQMENCYIYVARARFQGQPGHMAIWEELSVIMSRVLEQIVPKGSRTKDNTVLCCGSGGRTVAGVHFFSNSQVS